MRPQTADRRGQDRGSIPALCPLLSALSYNHPARLNSANSVSITARMTPIAIG
jgi:hypothetical protein